jgi:hypothetical protein
MLPVCILGIPVGLASWAVWTDPHAEGRLALRAKSTRASYMLLPVLALQELKTVCMVLCWHLVLLTRICVGCLLMLGKVFNRWAWTLDFLQGFLHCAHEPFSVCALLQRRLCWFFLFPWDFLCGYYSTSEQLKANKTELPKMWSVYKLTVM